MLLTYNNQIMVSKYLQGKFPLNYLMNICNLIISLSFKSWGKILINQDVSMLGLNYFLFSMCDHYKFNHQLKYQITFSQFSFNKRNILIKQHNTIKVQIKLYKKAFLHFTIVSFLKTNNWVSILPLDQSNLSNNVFFVIIECNYFFIDLISNNNYTFNKLQLINSCLLLFSLIQIL